MRNKKNACLLEHMAKLHKDRRGMSLVEVIVAITILGLVAVPVLHSLTTSMVYNQKARTRQELTLTAESIMETFKGYDLEELKTRFSPGGGGIEGIKYESRDADSGFSCDDPPNQITIGTETADEYVFHINDLYVDEKGRSEGKFYDVTITATPNSVEKVMEPENMETTRDAIYKGNRSFDTGALQKAREDFNDNHQSDLANYFAASYSDAVIKKGSNIITVKDEIAQIFDASYASFYVGNYIKLHEKRMEFQITKNASDEYVVTPKMYYSYCVEDYPYYTRVEPGSSVPDEYGSEESTEVETGNADEAAVVEQDTKIRYPATGYLETEIDLSSDYSDGYCYKNPVTAGLDRLFVYYYPQYGLDAGCDKIVVDNQAGIPDFHCYILKQRAADINDNQMKIKENGYKANVEIKNSASGFELFHNFDDNIADGSSTTAPNISGTYEKASSYTKLSADGITTELAARFSEQEVLSYKLTLSVKQEGRATPVTTLESSMNEKIK